MEEQKKKYGELIKPAENAEAAFARLIAIIELLRRECPWDRVQTHKSLRPCMLEEAYEVADAIDSSDMDNLEEELGDVLLQVVFHTSLASENNKFAMTSLINRECDKMVRRHPHVFLQETAKSVDKVLEKWENVKKKEHGQTTQTQRLSSVPKALPALIRGYKVQARAAEVGFDWDDVAPAFQKIKEETGELLEAYRAAPENRDRLAEELGDLLFSVVNAARFLKVDPEQALTSTSEKFIRRFSFIEEEAFRQGKQLEEMTLTEMDKLWEAAKKTEG